MDLPVNLLYRLYNYSHHGDLTAPQLFKYATHAVIMMKQFLFHKMFLHILNYPQTLT